jgi:hypothetical protein
VREYGTASESERERKRERKREKERERYRTPHSGVTRTWTV